VRVEQTRLIVIVGVLCLTFAAATIPSLALEFELEQKEAPFLMSRSHDFDHRGGQRKPPDWRRRLQAARDAQCNKFVNMGGLAGVRKSQVNGIGMQELALL